MNRGCPLKLKILIIYYLTYSKTGENSHIDIEVSCKKSGILQPWYFSPSTMDRLWLRRWSHWVRCLRPLPARRMKTVRSMEGSFFGYDVSRYLKCDGHANTPMLTFGGCSECEVRSWFAHWSYFHTFLNPQFAWNFRWLK